jgi:hypothetical protein
MQAQMRKSSYREKTGSSEGTELTDNKSKIPVAVEIKAVKRYLNTPFKREKPFRFIVFHSINQFLCTVFSYAFS